MARITKMVSDISGQEANEDEFISLVVTSHPEILSPRQLDVLASEIENLKTADNLVSLTVKDNGSSRDLVMTLAEFRKLVPDKVVKGAQGTRGRRKGFSPKSKAETPATPAEE